MAGGGGGGGGEGCSLCTFPDRLASSAQPLMHQPKGTAGVPGLAWTLGTGVQLQRNRWSLKTFLIRLKPQTACADQSIPFILLFHDHKPDRKQGTSL